MAELAAGSVLAQPLAEMLRSITIICALACAFTIACAPGVRRSGGPQLAAQLGEFWIDPGPTPRDLFAGLPANGPVRPATDARFTVVKCDTGGFSLTCHVNDERGREWSVTVGPEAQPEVVSARIVWAVGYHQVPSFFVEPATTATTWRPAMSRGYGRRSRKA
jgi:hypothetical protein